MTIDCAENEYYHILTGWVRLIALMSPYYHQGLAILSVVTHNIGTQECAYEATVKANDPVELDDIFHI